jgi:hypothetical protein
MFISEGEHTLRETFSIQLIQSTFLRMPLVPDASFWAKFSLEMRTTHWIRQLEHRQSFNLCSGEHSFTIHNLGWEAKISQTLSANTFFIRTSKKHPTRTGNLWMYSRDVHHIETPTPAGHMPCPRRVVLRKLSREFTRISNLARASAGNRLNAILKVCLPSHLISSIE